MVTIMKIISLVMTVWVLISEGAAAEISHITNFVGRGVQVTNIPPNVAPNSIAAEFTKLQRRVVNPMNERLSYDPFSDTNLMARLEAIAQQYPKSAEGKTALLWLVTADLQEFSKIINIAKRRQWRPRIEQRHAFLMNEARSSWHSKIVELQKCDVELLSGEMDKFRNSAAAIISSAARYRDDPDPQYDQYFRANQTSKDRIVYDLRVLIIMSYAHEGNLETAVRLGEILKKDEPLLARRDKLDSALDQLRSGKSPWELPIPRPSAK